jgi:hypothetical protein
MSYKYWEETSFTVADSPRVIDLRLDLGHYSRNLVIAVDGTGDLLIEISQDGTNYGTQLRLKKDESLDSYDIAAEKVRLTHSGTDTAYRIIVN